MDQEAIAHCLSKVGELAALESPTARDLFQLGYNLGRLSELTGLGREVCWDPWKDRMGTWDSVETGRLAAMLKSGVEFAEES